jgi:hypothetical protein
MADLDELLKLLEQEVQKKREDAKASSPSSKDSFERFVEDIGVKKGLDRIPNYVVFYTYKKVYKKALGEKRYSKIHFFRRMSQFFDTARVGKQRYYLLDKDSFDMTKEGKLIAKEYNKEYHRLVGIRTGRIKPKIIQRRRRNEKTAESKVSESKSET